MKDSTPEFDDYARRTIRVKVRPLIGILGFTEADREDLEQELAVHLIGRLGDYKAEKGSIKTFVRMVVESKIRTMITARKLRNRAFDNPDCSLNEEVAGTGGERLERLDCLDSEEHLMQLGYITRGSIELAEMRADVSRTISHLPPRLQELCRRLATQNVTEISRSTGVSRPTIYKDIRVVRRLFWDAGLDDYL